MTSDLETNMVSVERIKEYVETPSEVAFILYLDIYKVKQIHLNNLYLNIYI